MAHRIRESFVGAAPSTFQRHLGVVLDVGPEHALARTTLRPDLCDATGRPRLGVVATLADCAAGMCVLATVVPAWTATMDLTVHEVGRPNGDELLATGRVLHRRRSGLVVTVEVVDRDATTVATALGSFAELTGREESGFDVAIAGLASMSELPDPDAGFAEVTAHVGMQPDGHGRTALDVHDGVRNTADAMLGGAVALLAEAAAARTVSDERGGPWRSRSLQVHYLGPGRVGPVVATSTVLRADGDDALVEVAVADEGADRRPMAVAYVTLQPA